MGFEVLLSVYKVQSYIRQLDGNGSLEMATDFNMSSLVKEGCCLRSGWNSCLFPHWVVSTDLELHCGILRYEQFIIINWLKKAHRKINWWIKRVRWGCFGEVQSEGHQICFHSQPLYGNSKYWRDMATRINFHSFPPDFSTAGSNSRWENVSSWKENEMVPMTPHQLSYFWIRIHSSLLFNASCWVISQLITILVFFQWAKIQLYFLINYTSFPKQKWTQKFLMEMHAK
jgi:hypothetical protein